MRHKQESNLPYAVPNKALQKRFPESVIFEVNFPASSSLSQSSNCRAAAKNWYFDKRANVIEEEEEEEVEEEEEE